MASWLWPTTRIYWDHWDQEIFFLLNSSLAENSGIQLFWSIANHRLFDLVSAGIFGVVYLYYLRKNRAEVDPLYTIAHGVFMTLCAVVVIQVMHLIFSEGRLSPTLVLEPHYKLTELVPWINAKDASSRSFPGDHATVLLLFSIFIHAFCGRRYAWIYILVIIFSLPRLVSGAHWFTDVMIGGAATALMVAPLTIVTPIRNRLCQAIYCSIKKIKRRLISE